MAGVVPERTEQALSRAREAIVRHARLVDDFPSPGIAFKDLTPVLADAEGLSAIVTALTHGCNDVDLVAGIDARGFLLGGAVARELEVGVLAVRKGGKLPPPVHAVDYSLEYGSARLEIPADGLVLTGRRVLLVDDVLATGGTAVAAAELLQRAGASVVGVAVIMEIVGLGGRDTIARGLGAGVPVHSVALD
ncbi:adenine phosphoribosyltransferase [Gordonia jinghuaiqii]|uniref:Adenine phosphoribosyltransferase n=1 Tax=Gordonia jinghuaiqii TaxID=2758710 RepID=A0A7D7LZG2_9ACTN|nr:adenine phosphoribosyltransferase [Gordonia jinghuaiqii]MCR5976363.1 adenine phosphoribosyltransferase [Gordonia jinghuaiqii]QMT03579.1 adenine phosphoribosyltransferase [Gordonia jinghuaiqii]